jgi:hypothetical protein
VLVAQYSRNNVISCDGKRSSCGVKKVCILSTYRPDQFIRFRCKL